MDRILDESKCLLCISTEYAKIFVYVLAEKVSKETAERIQGCTNRRPGTNFKPFFLVHPENNISDSSSAGSNLALATSSLFQAAKIEWDLDIHSKVSQLL